MGDMKPCPFCGDTFIETEEIEINIQLWVEKRYRIGCGTKKCFGCRKYSREFETEKEAIEAWNNRA